MKFLKVCSEERTLAVLVLAGGIFVGLAYPDVADWLRPWALPALFLVVVFSLVPFACLGQSELISIDHDMMRTLLWQQIVLPCIVISAGVVARIPDSIILLMIVTACSGSVFSSPALAEILGLDRKRALQAMVISTLFMPMSLYLFLSIFRGAQVELNIGAYLARTLVFLVAPFALLAVYRFFYRRQAEAVAERIDLVSRWATILALLVFGTGLMSAVSDKLESDPSRVLFMLGLATTLCLVMMGLTTIVMHRFGSQQALTVAVVSGFRNVGLGFALVGEMIGPDLAVYAGISLLPVFIAPLLLRVAMATMAKPMEPGPTTESVIETRSLF